MLVVVRFQHRYYVPLTISLGLILPTIIAAFWKDMVGGFIWGGIVARLLSESSIDTFELKDQ